MCVAVAVGAGRHVPPGPPARADSVADGLCARPGPENAGKILVLLTAAGPGRSCCSFSQYRLVASWKGLAAAAPAAQQVGDQVLCPGNIATAGREWAGAVTRLGSTGTASYAACSAEPRSTCPRHPGPERHAEVRRARQLDKAETRETNTPC